MAARLHQVDWIPASLLLLIAATVGLAAGLDPRLALIVALGLAFVAITFADLAAGVVLLIVVVFAETTPLAGSTLTFTKLAGLLLVLAWVATVATQPSARRQILFADHPGFSYLLALFLAWAAISTLWAANVGEGLTETSRFLLVATLYGIVYTAVATQRQAAWIVGGFVAGAAGTAAYGLVVRPEGNVEDLTRLTSTVQDPNVLAATLVAGLALSAAAFVAARGSTGLRAAAATAAVLCLAAFLLTGSRGGLVALIAALATSLLVAGRWRGKMAATVAVVVAGSFAYYALYAPPETRDRITAATQGEVQREEGRFTIWTVGWRMVEANPVTGVGVGNFKSASLDYVLEPGVVFRTDRVVDKPAVAHNTYLHVLAELGAVGLMLFLAILGFSIACAAGAAKAFQRAGQWRLEVLSRGLIVAIAGLLAASFFVSEQSSKVLWLLLSLGPAFLAVARSDLRATSGAAGER